MSRLDVFYRKLLLTKFFTKGWGKPDNLKRLFNFRKIISDRETCQHLVDKDYPIHIDSEDVYNDCHILSGHFLSPFDGHMPGIMPTEVQTAKFQMILPKQWTGDLKPVCVHLAGTGDHGFWRRRTFLAKPLLKENNIASVILENPYYGVRKPKEQFRSCLRNVSDLFVMGGALVLESLALFHWLEREGYGPLGITGISMGGHMASLAASNWHKPLSLIPCLSWSTASSVFTEGILKDAIPWKMLQEQYEKHHEYSREISRLMHSPERSGKTKTKAFLLGQNLHQYVPTTQHSDSPKSNNTNIGLDNSSASSGGQALAGKSHSRYSTLASKAKDTKYKDSSNTHTSRTILSSFQNQELHNKEALEFMQGVMDECTHLGNFSVPVDPSLIRIVIASNDAYVPLDRVMSLREIWPGAEVRYIDRGHIAAFIRDQHIFREAIKDSFDRQIEKYINAPPSAKLNRQ